MTENEDITRRMVESAGHTTQSMGLGRVIGQIYMYLYFNREPQTLNDLTSALGISKGSASMCVRQLEQWGALEKIWIKGDRKDYYSAKDSFGRMIKNAILDLAGKRITDYSALMDEVETELQLRKTNGNKHSEDDKFVSDQINKLRSFQKKTQGLWDGILLKMLLK